MMNLVKNWGKITLALTVALFAGCSSSDKEDEMDDATKGSNKGDIQVVKKHDTALLLCSFGSTFPQPQETYKKIIADYKKEFPNTDIYLSFTSHTIVNRVKHKFDETFVQPDVWLEAIGEAGYKEVHVQSLHIIPGEEYLSLMNTNVKKDFMNKYTDVRVAKSACLLDEIEDVDAVADILYNFYQEQIKAGEVVAFMGHGNPDKEYVTANARYAELEVKLQELAKDDKGTFFVGTVDWGEKMFQHVLAGIKEFASDRDYKDVIVNLAPLMSIAGDHAQNDMLGDLGVNDQGKQLTMDDVDVDEDDEDAEFSWKLKLEKVGFTVSKYGSIIDEDKFNVLGLADHKAIRQIWIKHMHEAIEEAESWDEHLE